MPSRPEIDLFAVQARMELADYLDGAAFESRILSFAPRLKELRQGAPGPGLAVFPEDIGMFLAAAGCGKALEGAATTDDAFDRLGKKFLPALLWTLVRYRTANVKTAFWLVRAPVVRDLMIRAFSRLALETGLFVVAGSASLPKNRHGLVLRPFTPDGNQVYNLSYTFGPDGKLLAETAKVNLVPEIEDTIGLSQGDPREIKTVDLGGAKVATAICYDGFRCAHTKNEPAFLPLIPVLDKLGADIVAQPAANPWPWEEKWVWGAPDDPMLRKEQWFKEGAHSLLASMGKVTYVVNPQLVATFLSVHFDGRSVIMARENGKVRIMAEASTIDQAEIVHARVAGLK